MLCYETISPHDAYDESSSVACWLKARSARAARGRRSYAHQAINPKWRARSLRSRRRLPQTGA
eukprot:15175942-Heterocapsa_arctica.AAC.1